MKYKIGQMIIRNDTGQKFTIKKDMGLCRKINSFGFERMYELKGPHPSLDLIVTKRGLKEMFSIVN